MIATQIKEKIQDGSYRAGERLPSERELAEKLTVSRPSVREALIALEIEGWVDVRVGTGVFVTSPELRPNAGVLAGARDEASSVTSEIGAADLLQARLLIEPVCAELAARNATLGQLEQMRQSIMGLPHSGNPTTHNDTLHLLIAEASGNAALASIVQHLWKLSEASAIFMKLNQHYVYDEVWEKAHVEHLELLTALQRRRPKAARGAMHAHLMGISQRLGLDANDDKES